MTPAYAAPEQLSGGQVGVYTDVYSLGVVLYELLTGTLPDTGGAPSRPSDTARARGLHDATARMWSDLDVLCMTAMRGDPERRYRSIEALVRDIDHYLHGEPLEARPDSVPYRLGKFVRRNRAPVIAAAAAVILLVAVTIVYTVRVTNARNAALAEAARTQRIQHFMLNLFEGGDEAAGPSDSLRVITLVDRGAREARTLTAEPAVQAELFATLGTIYQTLGSPDRADTLLTTALSQRRAIFGVEHPDVASSLVALGSLRADQAQFDDAERMVREGLAMDVRTLPPNHPAIARANTALGQVLNQRGAYAQAVPILENAVRIESSLGAATPELNAALSELANTHFYLGHYATSDSINRRVLAMSRTLYGDNHPHVATDLVNLGALQAEWGHYKDAERYYREAIAINLAWYGKDNAETASDLTMLGRTLVNQERYDEARDVLQQALATQEHVYGKVHPRVASALNELGRVALAAHKLDEAEAAYRRMLAIYHSVYGDKHFLIAVATSNLASVYSARQQYAQAEPLYREAIRRFTDTQGAEHPNTGIARIKLGRSLLRQRRFVEAEKETLGGYTILNKQTDQDGNYIRNARIDLSAIYDSLGQRAKGDKYRAELAAMDTAGK